MDVKSIIKLIPGFKPTPKSGTVSTIQKSASAFVKRRKQTGAKSVMPVKKAMGGQASESVARSKILKDQRDRKRKSLLDSINRTPGGAGIPKNKGMGPALKRFMEENPSRMNTRILNLARSRKPTGRLNIDDFMNAKMSGVLAGADPFSKTGSSKGPAGKVKKKKK